jgi:hypothetical protein
VRRVPLLSGSRVVVVPVGDEDVVLQPPPPPARVVNEAAAVRDALRFPLSGPPLSALAGRRARATIVVEPPALPFPGAPLDPRRDALAAVIEELSHCGIPDDRQTILVSGGLGRRLGQRDLEHLLPPPQARAFRGRVLVHDVEDPGLVQISDDMRINAALLATDVVVVVSAAETVLHGGPGALLSACDAQTIRRGAGIDSLLQAAGAPEWALALAVEDALASRVALAGISLVLDHPRLTGRFRAYPHEDPSLEHVIRSPFRRIFSLLPGGIRQGVLRDQGRRVSATAAYAGPPSVAHAEALLRCIELRGVHVKEPFDTLVVGVPWVGPHFPREAINPVTSATVSLGLALRLWRDAFPVRPDGTLVLVHSLQRMFAQGTQDPYQAMFATLGARDPNTLAEAEQRVARDARALAAYRAGRTCHPLLPYADWAGCGPALSRLGRVIVAGSRDAVAARRLGFVPSHSISSALEMAHGVAGGIARVGVLLAPPYPPLLVG